MKGNTRCWGCVAMGLLLSALVHGAAAGWWLRSSSTQAGLNETRPETQLVNLDLAVFGPAPGAAQAVPDSTEEPETVAAASAPEPEAEPAIPPARPEAVSEAHQDPLDSLVAAATPEPAPPEPELAPEPEPEPEPASPVPATPKPAPLAKPPEKRPIRTASRPRKEVQRPPSYPERQNAIKAPDPRRTEVADIPPRPAVTQGAGPRTVGAVPSAAGSGTDGAPSAAKAEAAYLAELQRAIARHQHYPDDARSRSRTGVTTLAFVVQGDGRIQQVRIAKSSGDASLDQAAVKAMERLSRFKPIPEVIGRREWAMRVPIRFDLR